MFNYYTKRAIYLAGGQRKVARALGVSDAAVHHWLYRDSVPASRVNKLCELAGGAIKPSQLRPDIFL